MKCFWSNNVPLWGRGKTGVAAEKTSRPGARARTTINLALLLGGLLSFSTFLNAQKFYTHQFKR